ncbi:MAG: amidase family protein, partial [Patescibacteria group bacterium]
AFKIGEQAADPLKMYLEDIFVTGASLAGLPAISIPCGFTKPEDGETEMPVGMQLIAGRFKEDLLMRVGYNYEKETEWNKRKPVI